MNNPQTIADIFRRGFTQYLSIYGPVPKEYHQVAYVIMNCRTEVFGGHVYRCDTCNHEQILYNSCRNRHCPLCQGSARMRWVSKRIDQLLPIGYFHVVFTLYEQLRPFFLRNRDVCYRILFRALSETLTELGADPKRLGGIPGFIAVLHTWGQNLEYHPHIHCIFAGGVLSKDHQEWISTSKDFLFPQAVVKKLYKGKLLAYFKEAVQSGEIGFHGELAPYAEEKVFKQLLNDLYSTDPVVYLKEPFASAENLIQYLGNYTHKVALSQKRIISVESGYVSFTYKDYADENKQKVMKLTIVEFIRRFLLHVLPQGFMRIRHYGFLSNRNTKKLLPKIRKMLKEKTGYDCSVKSRWIGIIEKAQESLFLCPACQQGKLYKSREIPPKWKNAA